MNKILKTKKMKLNSPYGYLTTVGNGKIQNGRSGLVETYSTVTKCDVLFEGEKETVKVPCHWIDFDSDEQN